MKTIRKAITSIPPWVCAVLRLSAEPASCQGAACGQYAPARRNAHDFVLVWTRPPPGNGTAAVAKERHSMNRRWSDRNANLLAPGTKGFLLFLLLLLIASPARAAELEGDRKSTRLNSSHVKISYAVFCLKKKKT